MSMTRRRLLDDTYKQTAVGNPIKVRSVARMRPEITMQGWTEQKKTTGAQLLDISDFETGAVSGTTSCAWLKFQYHLTEGETYTITNNGSTPITLKISYEQGGYSSVSKSNLTGSYSFVMTTHPNTPEGSELAVFIWVRTISELDELIKIVQESNIMLNEGDTALPYEPYTGGAPSPSPDYPQEIQSAGKETGEKWEYEIEVMESEQSGTVLSHSTYKSQTVVLTSDRPLTKWDRLEKRNGQWGWVYKHVLYDDFSELNIGQNQVSGVNRFVIHDYMSKGVVIQSGSLIEGTKKIMVSNLYRPINNPMDAPGIAGSTTQPRLWVMDDSISSVEEFRQKASELGLVIYAETAEETFVPLSTSEQGQMNELYTFRPTTVLSNDAGCNMELTYKTKKSLEVAT